MSFLNLFGSSTPASAPTQAPAGTPAASPTPGTPANIDPFTPNHTLDPKSTATPVAPLAEFGDLFKVDESAKTEEDSPFAWNYDKDTLAATVGNLNFVNPAEMQEVASALGVQNPEALATFMNSFGRNLYMQSLLVNSKMSEQSVNIAENRFSAKVPAHIRNSLVNNEVQAVDPNASNPALAPIVKMAADAIRQKNPNFTPEQVALHTKAYMDQVAQVYAPKPKTSPNNQLNTPADFSNFFTS